MAIIDISPAQVLAQTFQPLPVGVGVYMVLLLMCWGFVFIVNVQNGYRLFRLSRYLKKHHQRLWVELGFSLDDYGLTRAEIISKRDTWFAIKDDGDPELTKLKKRIRQKPTLTVIGMLFFIIFLLLGGLYLYVER